MLQGLSASFLAKPCDLFDTGPPAITLLASLLVEAQQQPAVVI